MKLFKNILDIIVIVGFLFLLLSTFSSASAESKKEASKDIPKYEIKSDIINFDYSNIGYPTSDCKIGFKNTILANTNSIPRTLQRGEAIPPPSNAKLVLDGIIYGFVIILVIVTSCIVLLVIGFIFEFSMAGIEKFFLKKS